ncbi:MAG: protein jag [Bryobacteraceae bacterium]
MKYTVDWLAPRLNEFLRPLLQRAAFDLTYGLRTGENPHPEVENPEVTVMFQGADVELLLNNRGELLLALEHISMEALRIPTEDHSLISFDANDYRLLRVEELRMSALAAADKVKRTRVPFHFNPMNSRERRVIHLALRDEKDLRSESLGFGSARAVVIVPADMPTPSAPPSPPPGLHRGGRGDGYRGGNGQRGRDTRREGQHRGGNRPPGSGPGRGPR